MGDVLLFDVGRVLLTWTEVVATQTLAETDETWQHLI